MKRKWLYIVLYCSFVLSSTAQVTVKDSLSSRLALRWSFVKNLYGPVSKAINRLTLIHKNASPLPVSGWKIYFNSNRTVDSASEQGSLRVRHVNGDLFYLEPTGNATAVLSGNTTSPATGTLQVEYTTADLTINVSDAPVGFYLVWNRRPTIGYAITDYAAEPVVDDQLGLMTPAMEFARNAGTKDIPVTKLPCIFPTPVDYRENTDSCRLTTGTAIVTDPAFRREADYLTATLSPIFGRRLSVNSKQTLVANQAGAVRKEAAIKSTLIILRKGAMDSTAYELIVSRDSVVIRASGAEGIFYGIQSLLSAIDPAIWKEQAKGATGHDTKTQESKATSMAILLPGLEVRDQPRFAFRGFMLDVARHFRTTRELCRVLDLMALCKMNALHLHFSDDEGWRLEIPSLPELTAVGGQRGQTAPQPQGFKVPDPFLPPSFGSGPTTGIYPGSGYYTGADFIKILRYARDRHIQIIPELECPGHARAAIKAMDARYEKYRRQGNYTEAVRYLLHDTLDRSVYEGAQLWKDNVICVALPSTYRFMAKVTEAIAGMYKSAGVPLTTLHLGGDEVAAGAWEGSPACRKLLSTSAGPDGKETAGSSDGKGIPPMDTATSTRFRAYCWAYFYNRLDSMLTRKGLLLSGWEEVSTLANKNFHIHVWDNMIGGGNEDLPYRLANAGYPVILSCVSNNYFDLAYNRNFDEKGYHWGGFLDMDRPWAFIPYDYYKNSRTDYNGNPVKPDYFIPKEKLTTEGRRHILGIEGLLWGEVLPSDERMEYMLLPRLLGTAERAWAADPVWATTTDSILATAYYNEAWDQFINVLSKRALPRLSYWNGGYAYRIPPAGALSSHGQLILNCALPGFAIRYSTDGSEPDISSPLYKAPITARGIIKVRVFDPAGRGGRVVIVENKGL